MSDRTPIYVVQSADLGHDVTGSLIVPDANEPSGFRALWGHMSSSMEWLVGDLTYRFSQRDAEIKALFPDGVEVVVVGLDDPVPAALAGLVEPVPQP